MISLEKISSMFGYQKKGLISRIFDMQKDFSFNVFL